MSLTLHLPPDLEQRLTDEAERQGLATNDYAARLIAELLPCGNRRDKMVALMQAWIDEPIPADEEAGAQEFIRTLEESHSSTRQLFPLHLKGITW